MKNDISVIIPVYNSDKIIPELLSRLQVVLKRIAKKFEVILINDGSQDDSWKIINQNLNKYPWLVGINLQRNYGQHNALLCGIRKAKNEVIVTMDDDLQHPPEQIEKLLKVLEKGNDVVYGIPKIPPHSPWRNFFSRNTKLILARFIGIPRVRDISSFRAFRATLRDSFTDFKGPDVFIDALLSWSAIHFGTVYVNEDPRVKGKSNYDFYKLAKMALLILSGFSTAPLRFASLVGFSFTVFGILIFIYVVVRYFMEGSIPGFPFLASIITIFSGTELFALGIFGEYLSHIFERSSQKPAYVIAEIKSTRKKFK
jgi:glycosyltransferase involved in cell wall biosynthesis